MAEPDKEQEGVKAEPPAETLPAPSTSSTQIQLTPSELQQILDSRKAAEADSKRGQSPEKRSKLEDSPDWANFLEKLTAKDIEFGDLDPLLQQELRSSKQTRDDFINLNLVATEAFSYDSENGPLGIYSLQETTSTDTDILKYPKVRCYFSGSPSDPHGLCSAYTSPSHSIRLPPLELKTCSSYFKYTSSSSCLICCLCSFLSTGLSRRYPPQNPVLGSILLPV